jgi:hypothetical protein
MAGSALLVAGLGWRLMSSSPKTKDLAEIDEINTDDCISPEEVEKIFDRLFLEMQAVLSQLMQQIQAIQQSGQSIPEKQLKGLLRAEMERALVVKQQLVVDEFDMDFDCVEEATWEFLEQEDEYPRVKRAVDRFQKLWESTTGEAVVGWRPGKAAKKAVEEKLLPPDELIELAEKYFGALTECMRGIVATYKTEGKNLQEPAVQQALNLDFAQNANDAGEEALKKEGVTMNQFEASIKAHGENPAVGRALGMLQMRQQQELMAMGSAESG